MEEEILFETRRHASRPHSTNYPPQQQKLHGGQARGLRAYLPFRGGITQLKEKWSGNRKPPRIRRSVSLFVSAKGEYVAVSSRNQIIILHKDNDYQEPVGIFTCANASIVTCGTWSESHALLGVADDTDTIYIIKPSGEEITRITKTHLNVSSPIVGLTMQCDNDNERSCLCTFCIFLSDGSVHDMEVSKDPSSFISSHSLKSRKMLRHFPQDLCCWDYNPQLSLFASVTSSGDIQSTYNGSTGSCAISLWRTDDNSLVEPVVLTMSGGSYPIEKGYQGQLACPKVLLSPLGSFVATLDMNGCLFAFKFDKEKHSLSKLSYGKSTSSDIFGVLNCGKEYLDDVLDFTWWSDCILSIAKGNRRITMVGVLNSIKISENDFVYSMPVLESARDSSGLIFLLENTSSENYILSEQQKCSGLIEHVMAERSSQVEFSNLEWSLISLTKRSVLETYDKLISSQRYQDALTFADHHSLDKDEVLKSQWLSSVGGVEDVYSILRSIKDYHFIISECVDRIGPTEDAMRALITLGLRLTDSYRFSESEEGEGEGGEIWNLRLARLKLLQFKDRIETFLGINMGRFSMQDYKRFRDVPIKEAALALAEDGKIGALNLLFKRHPCSLVPGMLDVLAAIPETIPVQSYGQLLPAISAPSSIVIRDEDWVECEKMVRFVEDFHGNLESIAQIMTEPMLSKHMAFQWPSVSELSSWYKKRARDIDSLSGQLDNCMCLVDFAIRKGISDLQKFLEDIFYLHQLIYSEDDEEDMHFSMTLTAWEQLPDYEKFKLMLMGVKEVNVISKLQKTAIPFMLKRFHKVNTDFVTQAETVDSFLVRWLKEIAADNKLDLCLTIFEACNESVNNQFFKDEVEVIDCALQCIYLCTDIDKWSMMCNILATLPRTGEDKGVNQRLRLAEGHIEAGRLMSYYQVQKPISFFLDADLDEKGVKQILRLLLSKFIRSPPSRTDNDWATMWRDMQTLQEKGFPFLELEYMFVEFCRGLLKAGKFSLARSYFKGTNSVPLAADKAENLVIQSAREYFFSAPTLSCPEIWRARECLNIFPNSRNVRAEADIIDAITDRLPNLGVNLLPMAFRQIKDPMEIIKLAITSQSGAYIHVDELVEIAKLLGLSSQEEISVVQEAIAREAAIAGHVQLAFDLCLMLAKKGHGSAWDLCAALARSQALDGMDLKSKKLLLGFALSHCDDESIGDLLNEWKDLDVQDHCESLIVSTGKDPSDFFEEASLNGFDLSGRFDTNFEDQDQLVAKAKTSLCQVAENFSSENGSDWESFLGENTKVASFAALQLPWLLELCEDLGLGKKLTSGSIPTNQHVSLRERAIMTTLLWLTRNSFAPKDNLIASLAKSIMESPASDEEDYIGCSVLLNLADAFHGVEIIEQQLRERQNYHEFSSLMNIGMMYGLLHNCGVECNNPAERRELLQNKFQEKQKSVSSDPDEYNTVREAQSTFWNEWKAKLEQQKHVADKSRILEKVIPGVETSRFISGDREYIENVVFSQIESVKLEKKRILKDTLNLAHTYGLDRTKVLLHYLGTILVSEAWSVDDIMDEISAFKEELLTFAAESVQIISSSVYPAIDGHDKRRLAFIYNLLYECYARLAESNGLPLGVDQDLVQTRDTELARFCDVVGKECSRVSFIGGLNFKNIAGLEDLNTACFNSEVCAHIDENNVEALATMVKNLVLVQGVSVPQSLMSSESVYTYHILNSLLTLEGKAEKETCFQSSEDLYTFMNEIEQTYDICKKHMRFVEHPGFIDTVKRFFSVVLLINRSLKNFPCDVTAKESLVKLINFWLSLIKDMEELQSLDGAFGSFYSECSMACLTVLSILLVKELLLPNRCWSTLVRYVGYGLECSAAIETYNFCRAMIFSGCGFKAMAHVFSEVVAHLPPGTELTATTEKFSVNIQDLPNLYLSILETVLQEIVSGSVERQSIHYLVSSLSKLEGNLDDLKNVRLAVWDHLSKFSHNLQLPSHLRVYVLELMQFISGKKRNLDLFPSEGPVTHLLTWEGWEDSQDRTTNREDESDDLAAVDSSNRFTNTLVALKSSQLVASISPDLEITPGDILSVETAVSCFLRLSESVTRMSHVDSLLAVLAEWEGLFLTVVDKESPAEVSDNAMNAWSNDDDWDEGWESFQEEPSTSIENESNKIDTFSIHPLHTCWSTILKKLVKFAGYTQILKLIDQSASKNYGALLDEEDTYSLAQAALEVDCFLALKIALLFPYKEIQTNCLDAAEKKLKEVGISDNIAQDQFLFLLVLSSGAVSSILTQACYGATFSYLCFMVGNFGRVFQETTVRFSGNDKSEESLSILFSKLLFPCFIAELVKADQHVLAGVLITRFMHTNASLSLINISEASLGIYLERQYQQQLQETEDAAAVPFSGPLLNTSTNLRAKLGDLIQSAISSLPNHVR